MADDEALDPAARTLDMIMLEITGGRERTAPEPDQLLARAGFHTSDTLLTPIPPRIVEAVTVSISPRWRASSQYSHTWNQSIRP